MHKVAVLALAVGAASAARTHHDEVRLFEDFRTTYGRKYSAVEEERAFGCFRRNLDLIDQRNREDPHATHGTNQFTDICPEDFKANYLGSRVPKEMMDAPTLEVSEQSAGPKINWAKKGAVTPIKNQGQCGDCWAFCSVANIEGQWFLAGNTLTDLSVQEVVSCSQPFGNMGCNGGLPTDAWKWMVSVGGLTTNANYPYTSGFGRTGMCKKSKVAQVHATVKSYKALPHNETAMANWLFKNGPIAAAIDAESWQTYSGGIITKNCGTMLDHGTTIVGYDDTHTPPYWILKNMWGTAWGEKGYVRIEKGNNMCGIKGVPGSGFVN